MRLPRPRIADPGRFALRGALRAAIAMPATFAVAGALGDAQTALIASFGTFALLVLVDFSGPRRARLAAYAALAATGAVLVPLGTLCSTHAVAAAAVMAAIGFAILFAGVVNGYLAAGANAALLMYILPAMVPAAPGEIGARLAGWGMASVAAIASLLLLWPRRPHEALREGAAAACRALAAIAGGGDPDEAHAAVTELRRRFAATPYRPTGPTGQTGALAGIVDELDWIVPFAGRLAPGGRDTTAIRAATADVLREAAALLEGRPPATSAVAALERERAAVTDALLARVADPGVHDDDAALARTLGEAWGVRVVSFGALEIARYAAVAGGARRPDPRERGLRALAAGGRLAARHASLRSVWLRNSARGAAGLALAVLVAQLMSVQHAFWVVLGTLSVLRSSALSIGRTALEALAGTAAGVVVGGLLVAAIDGDRVLLWVALPPAAVLAAYAPRAVSFGAGQAGFTVMVIVLFNLIVPAGWRVGLVRIEDIAIGVAISLAVGLLFWPRGAVATLRDGLGTAYARAAAYLEAALDRVLTGDDDAEATARERPALAAESLLDAAFRQALSERGAGRLALGPAATLVRGVARLRSTGDAMRAVADRVAGAPRTPACATALEGETRALRGWYERFGAALAAGEPGPAPEARRGPAIDRLAPAVREAVDAGGRDRAMAAVVATWAGSHADALTAMEERVAQAAAALRPRPSAGPQPTPAKRAATSSAAGP